MHHETMMVCGFMMVYWRKMCVYIFYSDLRTEEESANDGTSQLCPGHPVVLDDELAAGSNIAQVALAHTNLYIHAYKYI